MCPPSSLSIAQLSLSRIINSASIFLSLRKAKKPHGCLQKQFNCTLLNLNPSPQTWFCDAEIKAPKQLQLLTILTKCSISLNIFRSCISFPSIYQKYLLLSVPWYTQRYSIILDALFCPLKIKKGRRSWYLFYLFAESQMSQNRSCPAINVLFKSYSF